MGRAGGLREDFHQRAEGARGVGRAGGLRDRAANCPGLIKGRVDGATKQEGWGQVKFYTCIKGGVGGGSFSHAERGRGTKSFEVVVT